MAKGRAIGYALDNRARARCQLKKNPTMGYDYVIGEKVGTDDVPAAEREAAIAESNEMVVRSRFYRTEKFVKRREQER